MTGVTLLLLLNCGLSGATLWCVVRHHRMELSPGPTSVSGRLLIGLSDIKGRLDILERIVLKGGN